MFVYAATVDRGAGQAADGQERHEEAGVPEVPQAVLCQGRTRRGAADQLRYHGRLMA